MSQTGLWKTEERFDPNPTLRTGRAIDEADNVRVADLPGSDIPTARLRVNHGSQNPHLTLPNNPLPYGCG